MKPTISIIFIFFCVALYGQNVDTSGSKQLKTGKDVNYDSRQITEGIEKLYYNERQFGAVYTCGLGVTYRQGKHLTGYVKRIFDLDFLIYNNPKEVNVTNNFSNNSYVYGKLNSLFILRGGIGLQKTFFSKDGFGTVEVRGHFITGLSIAILKPTYYLYSDSLVERKFNINDPDPIYGNASFVKGINETYIVPGVYAKSGFSFEYSGIRNVTKVIETGVILDYYFHNVPLMAQQPNKYFFLSLYLSFSIGKRWN